MTSTELRLILTLTVLHTTPAGQRIGSRISPTLITIHLLKVHCIPVRHIRNPIKKGIILCLAHRIDCNIKMVRLPVPILRRWVALATILFLTTDRTRVDNHEGRCLGVELVARRGYWCEFIAETADGTGAVGCAEAKLVQCCVKVAGTGAW